MLKILAKLNICPLDYKNKWALGMILGFLLSICIVSGALFYDIVLETPYLSYPNIPFSAVDENGNPPEDGKFIYVKQGEVIPLKVARCNKDQETHVYSITHSLIEINKNEFTTLPQVNAFLTHGCDTSISRINRVPIDTPPGVYKVFGYAEIKGNIKSFSINWQSNSFIVVPKDKITPITIINNNAAPLASKDSFIIIETKPKK